MRKLCGSLSLEYKEGDVMKKKKLNDRSMYGYLFIAPFLIAFVVLELYPVLFTFSLSVQKWDGLMPEKFVMLENFKRLLSDKVFYLSIWNTLRIWTISYLPQILTALLLSALFTMYRIKGMAFFRAVFYLPNLITAASVGLLFNLLFNGNKSVVNNILQALGMQGAPFDFFNDPVFTSNLTSYIQWWMWFGYTTILVMAGITTIDKELFEAARIDGASRGQVYRKITLPLIKPTIIYITITSIIGGMQLFDVPSTMSDGTGEPDKALLTVSMYLYNQGFKNHNYGYSAAISVGLFVVICFMSFISMKIMKGGSRNEKES